MRLSELPKDSTAVITEIDIQADDIKSRLSDFGLQLGQKVSCVDQSPMGGPKAFRLSHGIFALDKEVSDAVTVIAELSTCHP